MAATLTSIEIIPTISSLALGQKEQFTVLGHYDDGSRQDLTSTATWTSSVGSVATIAATGLVTSVALGTTSIKAVSGAFNVSAPLTIVSAHHKHVSESIIMNTASGHLKFRQSFVYNTPQVVAGPDPYKGHIHHVMDTNADGKAETVIIQPKPGEPTQTVIEVRADIPAPGSMLGQEGRMLKDVAFPIKKIVESPTSSDSTAGIWTRGRYFAKKIKF